MTFTYLKPLVEDLRLFMAQTQTSAEAPPKCPRDPPADLPKPGEVKVYDFRSEEVKRLAQAAKNTIKQESGKPVKIIQWNIERGGVVYGAMQGNAVHAVSTDSHAFLLARSVSGYKLPQIIEELKSIDADVLALQEVRDEPYVCNVLGPAPYMSALLGPMDAQMQMHQHATEHQLLHVGPFSVICKSVAPRQQATKSTPGHWTTCLHALSPNCMLLAACCDMLRCMCRSTSTVRGLTGRTLGSLLQRRWGCR